MPRNVRREVVMGSMLISELEGPRRCCGARAKACDGRKCTVVFEVRSVKRLESQGAPGKSCTARIPENTHLPEAAGSKKLRYGVE
jgi:hypothetical protein